MRNSLRIVIIGAGSATFSATVIRDLCVTAGLSGSHVCLMDVNPSRLQLIGKLAHKINNELSAGLAFSTTQDREEALRDAHFVINTALDGGHPWSEYQRSLAEKHGFYRGAHLQVLTRSL